MKKKLIMLKKLIEKYLWLKRFVTGNTLRIITFTSKCHKCDLQLYANLFTFKFINDIDSTK